MTTGLAAAISAGICSGATFFREQSTADNQCKPGSLALWAWERKEDLSFLKPSARPIRVAYLARTITIKDGAVLARPRLQPLIVNKGIDIIPVVRIECRSNLDDETNASHIISKIVSQIRLLARPPNVHMIQVDFDARRDERAFYRKLLNELRARLPESTGISMTAIASWCLGDYWLDGLPVDEVVPMFFTMGEGAREIEMVLEHGLALRCPSGAKLSPGFSTGEPCKAAAQARRQLSRQYGTFATYIFNPRPWKSSSVQKAILQEDQWQKMESRWQ